MIYHYLKNVFRYVTHIIINAQFTLFEKFQRLFFDYLDFWTEDFTVLKTSIRKLICFFARNFRVAARTICGIFSLIIWFFFQVDLAVLDLELLFCMHLINFP